MEVDADKFSSVLADLKTSADELSKGNKTLNEDNAALKAKLDQLQQRMQKLQEEHNSLMDASAKLQEENPALSRKIAKLEEDRHMLKAKLSNLEEQQKAAENTIAQAKEDAQKLVQEMEELGTRAFPADMPENIPDGPDKEKLRLLKMIDDSKAKQAYLHRQIANLQQNKQISSIVTVQVPKDKDSLVNQSRQLQEEVEQLNKMAGKAPDDEVDEAQLQKLRKQMDELQKNHDELESLVGQMQQKVEKSELTTDQRTEQTRLKTSLEDINNEARRLKADLNDLRRQMVDLDKRKTYLDAQL